MKQSGKKLFAKATRAQNIEFGLMLVVISCALALCTDRKEFLYAAVFLGILALLIPVAFAPFTMAWFGLGKLLGKISSAVLLTIVFFLVVTPVGLVRRWMGKDPLLLKAFKKDQSSVFINRNQVYSPNDLTDLF